MKYQIVGKNMEVTDAISNVIQKKLSRMDKYFDENEEVSCRAVVRSYNVGAKVEITIFSKDTTFRAEVKNDDLYAAVDLAIDKLVGQMRKLKTKLQKRYEREGIGKSILFEELKEESDVDNEKLVKTKSYMLKPISMEDAIIQMESLGHSFYMYLDTDDEKISVLYKRNDGGYGLIQAENKVEL
jgi:putative sigma-54 modulation protein